MGFLNDIGDLKSAGASERLYDEIKVLSLSLLIDVAGYKECEPAKSGKYLEEIKRADILKELNTKVEELMSLDQSKHKQLYALFDSFYTQCNNILSGITIGEISKVQETYSKFTTALRWGRSNEG